MELKPCPRNKGLCHIEIIRTAADPPKIIRIGCIIHSVWLPESFGSVDEAVSEWNRRANDV